MLPPNSTTTPAPPTNTSRILTARVRFLTLINTAHDQSRIAGRIAQSFESLDEVSFSDLDAIARNCYHAARQLDALRRLLAESEVA